MIFAAIMAGGSGKRMNAALPKQFLQLGESTILEVTLRKFIAIRDIDAIFIGTNTRWREKTEQIAKSIPSDKPILCIDGGKERWETLDNVVTYIKKHHALSSEDILVTHDAVRPFVTEKMITDGIETAREYGASCAAIAVTDTIAKASDITIDGYVKREEMVCIQTPQSFRIVDYLGCMKELDAEKKSQITDATRVFVENGKRAVITPGDRTNLKITTEEDYELAKLLYASRDK